MLVSNYLSVYLSVYLYVYLSGLSTGLSRHLLLLVCLLVYLPICLPGSGGSADTGLCGAVATAEITGDPRYSVTPSACLYMPRLPPREK